MEGYLAQRPTLGEQFPDPLPMDCRNFRKHHLAYLDDTLSGVMTAEAQQHILACDPCAAHDTLVRRSLMIARSMPSIEPSTDFQRKLRERLAVCREEVHGDARFGTTPSAMHARFANASSTRAALPASFRTPRALAAVAVGAALGTIIWRGLSTGVTPVIAMQPVIASQPVSMKPQPVFSPALISVMSTGNPVWPAAMMIEEAPTQFVSTDYRMVDNR